MSVSGSFGYQIASGIIRILARHVKNVDFGTLFAEIGIDLFDA